MVLMQVKAAEIIGKKIVTELNGMNPPPQNEMKIVFDNEFDRIVKGLSTMTVSYIESLRHHRNTRLSKDNLYVQNWLDGTSAAGGTVSVPRDYNIARKEQFVQINNVMKLVKRNHVVNIVEAWMKGFHAYVKNKPYDPNFFIAGRDIIYSAVLLSIEEIINMMKDTIIS